MAKTSGPRVAAARARRARRNLNRAERRAERFARRAMRTQRWRDDAAFVARVIRDAYMAPDHRDLKPDNAGDVLLFDHDAAGNVLVIRAPATPVETAAALAAVRAAGMRGAELAIVWLRNAPDAPALSPAPDVPVSITLADVRAAADLCKD